MFNHEMRSFYAAFADIMTDDQGQKIDGDGEGSMPNWVPVFETGLASDFPGPGAPVRAAALLLARPKSQKKLLHHRTGKLPTRRSSTRRGSTRATIN